MVKFAEKKKERKGDEGKQNLQKTDVYLQPLNNIIPQY